MISPIKIATTSIRDSGPAVPVTLFQDSFTDTNGTLLSAHTPDVGSGWTKTNDFGADFEIQSGRLKDSESGGSSIIQYSTGISALNHEASFTIKALGDADNSFGLLSRSDGNLANGLLCELIDTTLAVRDNGAHKGSFTVTTDDVIKQVCSGSDIEVFKNDVSQVSYTTSVTSIGIEIITISDGSTFYEIDDFLIIG